eukprot:2463564-Rhodomonas_salina.2
MRMVVPGAHVQRAVAAGSGDLAYLLTALLCSVCDTVSNLTALPCGVWYWLVHHTICLLLVCTVSVLTQCPLCHCPHTPNLGLSSCSCRELANHPHSACLPARCWILTQRCICLLLFYAVFGTHSADDGVPGLPQRAGQGQGGRCEEVSARCSDEPVSAVKAPVPVPATRGLKLSWDLSRIGARGLELGSRITGRRREERLE